MVPIEEQIENSSLDYEKSIKTWFLFTNHIGIDGGEYTDAIWVYWSKDPNQWEPKNKAIVLNGQNCTWSNKCIGLPTVVLVTHFMEEAERLCDRVAIVDRGSIIATGSPSQLVDNLDRAVTVLFTSDCPDIAFLEELPEVSRVQQRGERVTVEGHGAVLAHVAAALVARDIAPPDLRVERATLEDVFLETTGHAMTEWQCPCVRSAN